ncbi:MAG: hypothetical protein ABSG48_00925 [Geobacteraceae bacterium]|jgi:hypothetical protein
MSIWVMKPKACMAAAAFLTFASFTCSAEEDGIFRLGYLAYPGSALCLVAAQSGHFQAEGLRIQMVAFTDSASGLASLEAGTIDSGAFGAGESLREIARGKKLRIIAGGGVPTDPEASAGIDGTGKKRPDSSGIVVLVAGDRRFPDKVTITRLTAALIRAHQTLQLHTKTARSTAEAQVDVSGMAFDPNPDYWRLEKLWRELGLQDAAMPRDFLASHVYEEIYCDALDRILVESDLNDPVIQQLFIQAVCTPNCCPANSGKLFTTQQGGNTL